MVDTLTLDLLDPEEADLMGRSAAPPQARTAAPWPLRARTAAAMERPRSSSAAARSAAARPCRAQGPYADHVGDIGATGPGPSESVRQAGVALRRRYSASSFVEDIWQYGTIYFTHVGRALQYLPATSARPDDRDNALRSGSASAPRWGRWTRPIPGRAGVSAADRGGWGGAAGGSIKSGGGRGCCGAPDVTRAAAKRGGRA